MQKFIITGDGTFKYGDVTMHRDLLEAGETCLGGGFYAFDYVSSRLLLTGRSYDYGKPRWNRIDVLKMPAPFAGLSILYEGIDITLLVTVEYV